jgi:4'-phosphopantetheinyl transferase
MTKWYSFLKIPDLGRHEIHVWRFYLNQSKADVSQLKDCLSVEEYRRAASFHFIRDQTNFVIRRAILRHLTASYLGLAASSVKLLSPPNGKLVISGQDGLEGIRFNCSHSADWGLIAIARNREVGVDLEQHRPLADVMALANTCFSHHEIAELTKVPEGLKTQCFYNGWTRKEAFVKAIGLGLSFPPNNVSVSLALDRPAKLLKVEGYLQAWNRWKLVSFDVNPGYSAALVYENKNANFKYFEWIPFKNESSSS